MANVGLQSAGPFRVRWYLSRDAAGSADDLLLHFTNGAGNTYNHPGIEASGEGAPFTATLQLPAAPPAGWGSGDLFVVMKTDASNHVAESDEINNFGQMGAGKDSCRVSVGADLRGASCSELRADRWGCKGFWGGALSMAGRIHNVGPGNAGASRVQWLLSRDSLGSEDDLPLSLADGSGDMLPVPSLPAGASHEVEAVVRLPATPPAGWTDAHSYVVMRSDAGGAVHETDELNNAGQMGDGKDSIRATVRVSGPDLYGAQCSAYYEPVLWGQSLNVVVRIGNAGDQPAGSFHVSWYLSKDRVGSGDDLLLTVSGGGTRYRHPGIGAGNPGLGRVFDIALGLPAEPPVGWTGTDFYVVMKTDADNEVAESREENNFGAAQQGPIYDSYLVKVGTRPELRGERLSNGWGPVVWGGEMHVFAQIANEGSLPSSPFQVQWFLSKDAVASADDLLLRQADGGTASYSHWGVDGSYSGEPCPAPSIGVRLALPATRPAGWVGTGFHLIMKTDAADQVAESNEGNNFGQVGEGKDWMAVTISDP